MSEDIVKTKEASVGRVMLGVIVIWASMSVFPYVIQGLYSPWAEWTLSEHALFGDTFGFTNSFFSSLALAFLVYSSYLQRRDLDLQRRALKAQEEELQLTREEHRKSAAAQAEAAAELKEQNRLQLLSLKLDTLEKSMDGYVRHIKGSSNRDEVTELNRILRNQKRRYTELYQELNI